MLFKDDQHSFCGSKYVVAVVRAKVIFFGKLNVFLKKTINKKKVGINQLIYL